VQWRRSQPAEERCMIGPLITRFATGLRFPTLFMISAALFLVDLVVPDMIPFFDEIFLALLTLLLGTFRRRGGPPLEGQDPG
jgi:hypothetical protein